MPGSTDGEEDEMATKPARAQSPWREQFLILVGTTLLTLILLALSSWVGPGAAADGQVPGRDIALPVHLICALVALPLGALVLWGRKGTPRHKLLGRIWAVLMLVVAISSYWLRTLSGGFSFIHLLSVLTLVSIPLGIYQVRQGKFTAHLRTMRGVYIGLVVAGVFAMAPDRTLGELLFGW
jgi:uncharacterized membrane protein